MRKEALDSGNTQLADSIGKTIESLGSKYGIKITNFEIDENSYQEALKKAGIGSFENPLTAEDYGFAKGSAESRYLEGATQKITAQKDAMQEAFNTLSQYSAEDLKEIHLGNGQYDISGLESAEDALESIALQAGLSSSEISQLVNALEAVGVLKPRVNLDTQQIQEGIDKLKELQKDGKITTKIDLGADISSLSEDELGQRFNDLMVIKAQLEPDTTEYDAVCALIEQTQIQQKVNLALNKTGGDVQKLLGMTDEALAAECDINLEDNGASEQLENIKANLQAIQNGADVPITVKMEEGQFNQLTASKENEGKINVDANTAPAENKIKQTVENANKQKGTMTVDANTAPAISKSTLATHTINGMTATIPVGADTSAITSAIDNALSGYHSITVHANVTGLPGGSSSSGSKKNSGGGYGSIYTGTMLSPSHAYGTAYNVANYTNAFANGKVGLERDETALVNELGQESCIRGDKWFLLPPGMHVQSLKRGDIILNAQQTADLINHGKANGTARALASGTLAYSGMPSHATVSTNQIIGNTKYTSASSINTSSSGSSSGSKTTSSGSEAQPEAKKFSDWLSKLFNWAEMRLKRLNRLTEKWTNKAEQAVRYSYNRTAKDSVINKQYSDKTKYTQKAITATENEIVGNEKAISTYEKMLKKIKSKGGLSSKTIKKIKDDTIKGTFSIDAFSSDSEERKAIEAFQEYYEKILDCQYSIEDLTKSHKDLYDQFYNIPIEQATAKVEKYENAISKLNAAMDATSGGSRLYLNQVVADSKSVLASAQSALDIAVNNETSAKNKVTSTQKALASSKKSLSKVKGLSKAQKEAIKNGTSVDTSGLKGSALKKANAYNSALSSYNNALSAYKSAQSATSYASNIRNNASNSYEQAIADQNRYANAPDYEYQNYLLDQQTQQMSNENTTRQEALQIANKNLYDAQKAKESVDKSVSNRASAILSKYSKKLSSSQEKALQNGETVSTKGLSGSVLKAVKKYNSLVKTATDATDKYNSAVEAQATADQNAAEAQAEYTQSIQENAKAKFDNVSATYKSIQNVTDAKISKLNTQLSYRTAMGYSQISDSQKSIYNGMISENNNLLTSQKEELATLQKAYEVNVANMSEQDANDARAEIISLEESILSTQSTLADLQNDLNNLEIKRLEIAMDRLKANADSLKESIDLKESMGISATRTDYNALIANIQKQVENLQLQNAELRKQQEYYEANSEKYEELQQQIESNESAIRDATKSQIEWNNAIADIPYSALEKALDLLDAIADNNKSLLDLKEARGDNLSEADYLQQIQDNNDQISKLQEERQQALDDYRKALSDPNGVYGGKTADEWREKYIELDTEINKIMADNEELKDSMRDDVYWREFDKAHDSAKRLQDTIDGISNLISDDMYFDKDGNLTEYGVTQLANLTKQYELARDEVQNYENDIENLNKLYAEGMYTEDEYNEKLSELQDGLLDSASTMKEYQDAIVDMYKQMAQAELDALFDLIDARNKALSRKKAYYDYDKSIRSKTKDIQSIEAQIAALEGINTAEAKAKRASLEEERANAQEELDDTVQEHIFDLSQQALDDMKETLQEAFNDKFDYISSDLDEIVSIMATANELTSSSATTINNTLNKLLEHYGIDTVSTGIEAAYASGTTRVPRRLRALIGENGNEIATTKEGLVLTLDKGDGVIPSDMTENLMEMAMSKGTDEFTPPSIIMPNLNIPNYILDTPAMTPIEQHFDSLINIEGSADAVTVDKLKGMKDELLEDSYNYTSKKMFQGYIRAGGRRRI